MKCPRCASLRTKPYTYRPPAPGAHTCTPACDRQGRLCLNCRIIH